MPNSDVPDDAPGPEIGLPPAMPAATLVIFDEQHPPRDARLLMVRRSTAMAFAGGAVVFPGGRVDDDDHRVADRLADGGMDPDDAAARIAAIRETLEETGLATGVANMPPELGAAMRARLAEGVPFSVLLGDSGLTLDLSMLVPFTRWLPNLHGPRRFDTRFYLTRAPGTLGPLTVDASENTHLFWASAAQTLDLAAQGQVDLIFPTRRNLERLAQYRDFATACRSLDDHPSTLITPWIEDRAGQRCICIPENCGYPVTYEALADARRG